MVGKILLSCGHEDPDHENGWPVNFMEDEGMYFGLWCSKCFANGLLNNPKDFLTLTEVYNMENNVE